MSKTKLVGAMLLIAGCCIGAGMLGLPLITAFAGFLPASLVLFLSWAFMAATGLLIAEVYLNYRDEINYVTMVRRTLGKIGSAVAWVTFLFLFYCLLTAYVSALGALFNDLFVSATVPLLLLLTVLGVFLYMGTESTDGINRFLMVGLIASYCVLVVVSLPYVRGANLLYTDWKETLFVIPPFIVSFGYHNLIPGLGSYLQRNRKALRWAILLGSALPFFIYWIWEFVLLGMIPLEGEAGFLTARELGLLPAQILKKVVANPLLSHAIDSFSFFAIVTSFLAIALSITDFLADGLKLPKKQPLNKFILCLIVLIPPFLFALSDPAIFITALKRAGGIGAVILYGILPTLMVWKGRYRMGLEHHKQLGGGKPMLALLCTAAVLIVALHLVDEVR